MKDEKIVTQKKEYQEPKTVYEEKTIEEPKVVMEKRTVQQPKTVMETRVYEKLLALTCKGITGMNVINPQGEDLGKIADVMIDLQSGRVAYAVLSFSTGFLGMSNKLFAIPWEAMSIQDADNFYRDTDHKIILNIPQEALKNAEGFDKDNMPREPNYTWLGGMYDQYGYEPYWKTSSTRSERMSELDIESDADIEEHRMYR